MFVYNNNKVEPIIVLHWKEESINITNINIKRNAEDRSTIVQAPPDQFHPRQNKESEKTVLHRISD